MILNPRRLSSRATKNASRQHPPAAPVHHLMCCFPGRWHQISPFPDVDARLHDGGARAGEARVGDVDGGRSPDAHPGRAARVSGARSEMGRGAGGHEVRRVRVDGGVAGHQERRKKQKQMMAHGATLMGLHFVAEQLVSTTHSVALFAGLTARMVWLRRARRRRGAPRESFPRRHPLLSEPLF